MIFRLKTSKRTQEIFEELENRTNYKPYTLVKHAIAWSILEKKSVADYKSDSDGLDLNRQTITEEYIYPYFQHDCTYPIIADCLYQYVPLHTAESTLHLSGIFLPPAL